MAGVRQPSDKSHFLLPDLGEGLAEAELIDWKVKAGDVVKESQTIAEMQTDKALVEVPTPWAGTITELCGKAQPPPQPLAAAARHQVRMVIPACLARLLQELQPPTKAPSSEP